MAPPQGHFHFGPESGQVVLRTRREGFATTLGHDLTIDVRSFTAEVENLSGVRVAARVQLDSLAVREGTGGALPLTDANRREIDATIRRLLGSGEATFSSTTVTPGVVDGTLTLRGVARPLRLNVREVGPDRYEATGTVTQSAYGVKPYSAFFGALKLRDEVAVEVTLDVTRAR